MDKDIQTVMFRGTTCTFHKLQIPRFAVFSILVSITTRNLFPSFGGYF